MRQLRAHGAVERDACLCGLDDEVPVHDRGDAHLEDAAVVPVRQWRGGNLAVRCHIPHRLPYGLHDPRKGGLTRGSEPAQARELGAEADELVVFVGPEDAEGVLVGLIDSGHGFTSYASWASTASVQAGAA